jgi:hypothetical protein
MITVSSAFYSQLPSQLYCSPFTPLVQLYRRSVLPSSHSSTYTLVEVSLSQGEYNILAVER